MARAITYVTVTHMLLTSGLTGHWPTDRKRVSLFLGYLRRAGHPVELVWSIEPNPSGEGAHAHGWVRSSAIDHAQLQHHAHRAYLGHTTLRPVDGRHQYGYGFKLATHNEASLDSYLAHNGGRFAHSTRAFWVDPRTGEVMSQRRAMSVARRSS